MEREASYITQARKRRAVAAVAVAVAAAGPTTDAGWEAFRDARLGACGCPGGDSGDDSTEPATELHDGDYLTRTLAAGAYERFVFTYSVPEEEADSLTPFLRIESLTAGADLDLFVASAGAVGAAAVRLFEEAGGPYPSGLLTDESGLAPADERERWDGPLANGAVGYVLVYAKQAATYTIEYRVTG